MLDGEDHSVGSGQRERIPSVIELQEEIVQLKSKVVKNEGYRLLNSANQQEVRAGNARKQIARSGSLNAQRKASERDAEKERLGHLRTSLVQI